MKKLILLLTLMGVVANAQLLDPNTHKRRRLGDSAVKISRKRNALREGKNVEHSTVRRHFAKPMLCEVKN